MTNSKLQKGFTLIELVVAMFIMLLLASTVIINFRSAEKKQSVRIGVDTAIGALRNAQNLTLSGRIITGSTCGLGKAPAAYLVYFNSPTGAELYGIDKCNEAILVQSYKYPPNTFVSANGYTLNTTPASTLEIKFTAPFAAVTAAVDKLVPNVGPYSSFNEATLTLQSVDGISVKVLTMDGISGRIGE